MAKRRTAQEERALAFVRANAKNLPPTVWSWVANVADIASLFAAAEVERVLRPNGEKGCRVVLSTDQIRNDARIHEERGAAKGRERVRKAQAAALRTFRKLRDRTVPATSCSDTLFWKEWDRVARVLDDTTKANKKP